MRRWLGEKKQVYVRKNIPILFFNCSFDTNLWESGKRLWLEVETKNVSKNILIEKQKTF